MIIALPVILPLFFIILLLLIPRGRKWQRIVGVSGSPLLLLQALFIFKKVFEEGIQVLYTGGWEAPFGITLVVDRFSAIMLVLSGLIAVVVGIYSWSQIDPQRHRNRFYLFFYAVLMGVNGAFITGDIFNLYVWFEVMLLGSFVLITLGRERAQLRGAVKYVSMNLVSSLFFLAGIGLLYGKTGTLNMAALAELMRESEESILVNTSAMLFFIAFGIKSAIFPLFFWLPASYHTPPVSVTALFAGLLTKVGMYAMIRFYTMFFIENLEFWQALLLVLAGFTMVVGVLTAASQFEMRKILSFHIISQIGYMVLGLGLFTVAGVAGAIFYMAHNIVAKTNTFLASGMVNQLRGSFELKELGGLYKSSPFLAILFLVPAMGLAGIPPFSGFVGKLYLIYAGFEAEKYLITAVAVLVSLLTLFSMIKIWNEVFWKKDPSGDDKNRQEGRIPATMYIPVSVLALITILMGIFGGYFIQISSEAAEQLLHPEVYIDKVLYNN